MMERARWSSGWSISDGVSCRSNSPTNSRCLYQFRLNQWYFDEVYDLIFVRPGKWIGRVLGKVGDGLYYRRFGPGWRVGEG